MMGTLSKERLDILLVQRGLAESREKAQALIMAGLVFANGHPADKPGAKHPSDCELTVKGPAIPYVSRGGLKLEKALSSFGIPVQGKLCFDIGASTGGFTDCLLQHGARQVWAIDVGYGQLHDKLRRDPRVHVLERTNARYLTPEQVGSTADIVTIDVSFISLRKILPAVKRVLSEHGDLVLLVKPQFEAGREKVRQGVVRDPATHESVIKDIWSWLTEEGFRVGGLTYSPITGPEGNIEFLLHATNYACPEVDSASLAKQVVLEAHDSLASKHASG